MNEMEKSNSSDITKNQKKMIIYKCRTHIEVKRMERNILNLIPKLIINPKEFYKYQGGSPYPNTMIVYMKRS
jgi:hypothetical protein